MSETLVQDLLHSHNNNKVNIQKNLKKCTDLANLHFITRVDSLNRIMYVIRTISKTVWRSTYINICPSVYIRGKLNELGTI